MQRRLVIALAAVVAGCGGGSGDPAPPAATPPPAPAPPPAMTAPRVPITPEPDPVPAADGSDVVGSCDDAGRGWRRLAVRVSGQTLETAVLGRGPRGLVLANQSSNNPCQWMRFARTASGRGFRVLVFRYSGDDPVREALTAARALRAAGARSVSLMGSSVGGRVTVQGAARGQGVLAAAVSLSAERLAGASGGEILPDARTVRVPSLYAGFTTDFLTKDAADTRQLHAATPAKVNELLLVRGEGHGVLLLELPRVVDRFLAFLTEHG